MKEIKENKKLIGIIALTLLAAGISVAIAIRIRQLGTRPVAPSVPESKPRAEEIIPNITPAAGCQAQMSVILEFNCVDLKVYDSNWQPVSEKTHLALGTFCFEVKGNANTDGAQFRVIGKTDWEKVTAPRRSEGGYKYYGKCYDFTQFGYDCYNVEAQVCQGAICK